ncbi:hypothetical protein [Streptomyces sp. C1-2]|uniref:hypothetical protein n=1 Tax=Streptomyces sp. C1-2 TaxID=2720022 RepID=UPI0014326551|nr:hypothetical protein [Streptomyces sp. C1-2]NJP72174.1 hypothetical protein [Streptomyces sp. C1-2]
MSARQDEGEERSRAAGGCVLLVLAGAPVAAVWAVSPEAGVLVVWGAGAVLLWRSVRRTANPAPPPGSRPPSQGEEAGQSGVRIVRREGMLIIHDLSEQHRFDVVDEEVTP